MLAKSNGGSAALGGAGMGWSLFAAAKGGLGTSATGDKRTEGQKDDGVEDDLVDGMHYLGRGLGEVEYTAVAVAQRFGIQNQHGGLMTGWRGGRTEGRRGRRRRRGREEARGRGRQGNTVSQ